MVSGIVIGELIWVGVARRYREYGHILCDRSDRMDGIIIKEVNSCIISQGLGVWVIGKREGGAGGW